MFEELAKAKTYSDNMKALSELSVPDLEALKMLWGLEPIDRDAIYNYGEDKFSLLPAGTIAKINALKQTLAALEDSDEREKWANRIEGRPTQKTLNINQNHNSIEELESFTFDKVNSIFSEMETEIANEQ
ncbi:hypothetical protein [Streptococcus hyointestinalis]|uniref:hypothetical protein n=1 Tax=Streptococcus hyointestinalis TaxID=1337 RepID=UPI0013DE8718|nr:hypothetical protein [Streptococcus hyointestinalis]